MDPKSPLQTKFLRQSNRRILSSDEKMEQDFTRIDEVITHSDCASGKTCTSSSQPEVPPTDKKDKGPLQAAGRNRTNQCQLIHGTHTTCTGTFISAITQAHDTSSTAVSATITASGIE